MNHTALLLIDVQNGLLLQEPYRRAEFLELLKQLLKSARAAGLEVIHVRHDGSARDILRPGTPAWELAPEVAPLPNEKIFDKQNCSAFRGTGLKEYLETRGSHTLILGGMQTEYCVDATCKAAFEYGFRVLIPQGGATTCDHPPFAARELCKFYENEIWPAFAEVVPPTELFERLTGRNTSEIEG